MTSIESFFMLSALVVLIGLIVWRRDVKTGRIMRTKVRGPVTVMRERFSAVASTKPVAAPPPTGAGAAAADTESSTKVRADPATYASEGGTRSEEGK